jgi:glycosyltransferase involved in cell wall biosynthesis
MKRILLLDPGLLNRHGHHFHVDLAIDEACRARGLAATAFANRRVEPEIGEALRAVPLFRAPAYPSRDGARRRDFRRDFDVLNRLVEHDLRRGGPAPAADDLILVPTARSIHLDGMRRWYERLPAPRPRVCLRLLFEPGFRVAPEEEGPALALTRAQMRAWAGAAGDRLRLAAERRRLAGLYSALSGLPVHVLPMPIRSPAAVKPPRAAGPPRHVVYVGEARREKGFELLPDVCRRLLAAAPGTRFTVQAGCRLDVDPATVAELAALAPAVRMIDGVLSVEAYEELLRDADLVLAPYHPETYRFRTSQVFLEALGHGKPVVTTRGTWMHEQLLALDADGYAAERFDGASVAAAALRAFAAWPQTTAAAARAGEATRRRHNGAAFLDALAALTREAAA